jgi:hypothetical protein
VTFWDRLFRRSRRGDPSQYIPPQTYVDPGSTAPPPDPGGEHRAPEPEHGGQPGADPAQYDDPAAYDDPGQPGDAGGGDSGGGDGGGGGNGGGGGD